MHKIEHDPMLEYVVKPNNISGNQVEIITNVKRIESLSLRLKAFQTFLFQFFDLYDLVSVDFSLSKLAISHIAAKQKDQVVQVIRLINEMISKRPSQLALFQVIEYIPNAKALQTINFTGVSLSNQHAILLAETLHSNSSVKFLIIKHNYFNLSVARAFSEMLKHNPTLIELNLSGNNFPTGGTMHIYSSLKVNKTLKSLDLRNKESAFSRIKPMMRVFRLNSNIIDLKYL